jgi:hypothetical protein
MATPTDQAEMVARIDRWIRYLIAMRTQELAQRTSYPKPSSSRHRGRPHRKADR